MNFLSDLNVSDLSGRNGFVLRGIDAYDFAGSSVSDAGDINGDGIDDLIIGAPTSDPNGNYSGESYVVFGSRSGFGEAVDLASLDGSNGFILNGIGANDRAGGSVSSAGDINGDGIDDLIIGASGAGNASGESYIVFGRSSGFERELELSTLNGDSGFVVKGTDRGDFAGTSVSGAGDINGDGIDDVVISAQSFAEFQEGYVGEAYVLYGRRSGFDAELQLSTIDSDAGFLIKGKTRGPRSGNYSVSDAAGDVNDDGFNDIVVGVVSSRPRPDDFRSYDYTGTSYVVFGGPSTADGVNISELDGSNGFAFVAADGGFVGTIDVSGAGDINGDGFDDILVGNRLAGENEAGETYVVFGSASASDLADRLTPADLDGSNGFIIQGRGEYDYAGSSVSEAGDINGDGIDDLIVGSISAGPEGSRAGESYVVFGRTSSFDRLLNLSDLDGSNGFAIGGRNAGDLLGISVSGAGDINGDGLGDVIVGARSAPDTGLRYSAGESYVVFGRNTPVEPDLGDNDEPPVVNGQRATAYINKDSVVVGAVFQAGDFYEGGDLLSNTDGTDNPNDVIVGTSLTDRIWSGVEGDDTIAGGAGNDIIGFGLGNAQVDAGAGNDTVYAVNGGAGENVVELGTGDDSFYAIAGNNSVVGAGNNTIGIGTGNDTVNTFGGNDFVYGVNGGGGTNVLNLGRTDNISGFGLNTVWVERGDYTITSRGASNIGLGTGTDTVRVDSGRAIIYMADPNGTNDGSKDIVTNFGDDYIHTGSGDDLLDAGNNFNTLLGGAGADTFVFRGEGVNYLLDFELGVDKIQLADTTFSDLGFSQGTGDSREYIRITSTLQVEDMVFRKAIGYVANVTLSEMSNSANFV